MDYSGEDDREDNSRRRSTFALTPLSHLPPPSSSSTSSSSPTSWVRQTEANDDQPGSSSGVRDPPVLAANVEKEHMFDKVVTPSDVGKLNRLVIPKQHAEKYFPLDASANEKELLLNFEDRNGKPWRFRYSYWNSSQSYVMTKGWSRFVKEKRLDAGDTVSFGRGVGDAGRDRLFIDWKRRPEAQNPPNIPRFPMQHPYSSMLSFDRSVVPWSRLYTPSASAMPPMPVYDHHHSQGGYGYSAGNNPYLYLRSALAAGPSFSHSNLGVQMQYASGGGGGGGDGDGDGRISGDASMRSSPIVYDSVPVRHSSNVPSTNSKRVRLFGVNLDCSPSPSSSSYGDPRTQVEASQVRPLLSPALSLQLCLGDAGAATTNIVESPGEEDKQPMSLDLDI